MTRMMKIMNKNGLKQHENNMKKKEIKIEPKKKAVKELLLEYEPPSDIFTDEDEKTIQIKKAIQILPITDRLLFLMVVDMGSQSEVARYLNVSVFSIHKEFVRIKRTIIDIINKTDNKET